MLTCGDRRRKIYDDDVNLLRENLNIVKKRADILLGENKELGRE
jgi:hypothetical protein